MQGKNLSGDVKVWTYVNRPDGSSGGNGPDLRLNNGPLVKSADFAAGKVGAYNWVSLGDDGDVETIQILVNNANDSAYVGAIMVDGEILVDPGNLGTNGTALTFDPDNGNQYPAYNDGYDGTYYQSLMNGGFTNSPGDYDGNNLFGASQGTTGELVALINEIYSESIQIYGWINSGGRITLKISGTDYDITLPSNNDGLNVALTTVTGIPSSGTLEEIRVYSSGNGGTGFTGIYLDGVLLTRHSGIGADSSGNGNHYEENNLVWGNTSQLWQNIADISGFTSSGKRVFVGPRGAKQDTIWNTVTPPYDYIAKTASNYVSYQFETPIVLKAGEAVRALGYVSIGGPQQPNPVAWYINRGEADEQRADWIYGSVASRWVTIAHGPATIDTIDFCNDSYVAVIEIANKVLIDPRVTTGIDSVEDTPMTDFAILQAGANGRLQRRTTSTGYDTVPANQALTSGSYYWEVIPNDAAGYIEAGIRANDATGTSSVGADSNGWALINSGTTYHSGTTAPYSAAWGNGDVCGVAYNRDNGELSYFINGVWQGVAYTTSIGNKWPATSDSSNTTASTYRINFGQQPFAYATDNGNGTVSIPNDSGDVDVRDWLDSSFPSGTGNPGQLDWSVVFDGQKTSNKTPVAAPQNGNYNLNLKGFYFVPSVNSARACIGGGAGALLEINNRETLAVANPSAGVNVIDIEDAFGGDDFINKIGLTATGNSTMQLYWIEVNGNLLVNEGIVPPSGPFKKLYQTWAEWVVETLRAENAEAAALKNTLQLHAQTFDATENYCEGSVIKAFGELWIAINEAPATATADLAALASNTNWERLHISA